MRSLEAAFHTTFHMRIFFASDFKPGDFLNAKACYTLVLSCGLSVGCLNSIETFTGQYLPPVCETNQSRAASFSQTTGKMEPFITFCKQKCSPFSENKTLHSSRTAGAQNSHFNHFLVWKDHFLNQILFCFTYTCKSSVQETCSKPMEDLQALDAKRICSAGLLA